MALLPHGKYFAALNFKIRFMLRFIFKAFFFFLPSKRHCSLTADWLLRDTLLEVKGHHWVWLGQGSTGVLPQGMRFCLTRLPEVQRALRKRCVMHDSVLFQSLHTALKDCKPLKNVELPWRYGWWSCYITKHYSLKIGVRVQNFI